MNKSDLIEQVMKETKLPKKTAEEVIGLLFDSMTDALSKGQRIEIRGFGSLGVKHYEARVGRNPRTGESISVAEKCLPFFKVGKELRQRVDAKK